jgi:hypothetical protein
MVNEAVLVMDVIADFFKNNKLFQLSNCAICQSTTTYIYNGVPQWRHDEIGNLICKSCYDRRWRNKNPEHVKIYNILHQPRHNQLRRIRTTLKRGWGWVS